MKLTLMSFNTNAVIFKCLLLLSVCRFSFAETFVVALYESGSPPLFFEKGSSKTGIYKDILTLIGSITGDQFEYKYYPARRAMKLFESAGYDIEPGINPAWREAAEIQGLYTVPFAEANDVIVFRKNEAKKSPKPKDLAGERVGTINGFVYPAFSSAFSSGLVFREDTRTEFQLMAMLSRKRLNQILIRKDTAEYRIRTNPQFSNLEVGPVIGFVPIMFRFHPDKTGAIERFNKVIKRLIDRSEIEQIYNRYR